MVSVCMFELCVSSLQLLLVLLAAAFWSLLCCCCGVRSCSEVKGQPHCCREYTHPYVCVCVCVRVKYIGLFSYLLLLGLASLHTWDLIGDRSVGHVSHCSSSPWSVREGVCLH